MIHSAHTLTHVYREAQSDNIFEANIGMIIADSEITEYFICLLTCSWHTTTYVVYVLVTFIAFNLSLSLSQPSF